MNARLAERCLWTESAAAPTTTPTTVRAASPGPGLLLSAAARSDSRSGACVMVGDRWRDIERAVRGLPDRVRPPRVRRAPARGLGSEGLRRWMKASSGSWAARNTR